MITSGGLREAERGDRRVLKRDLWCSVDNFNGIATVRTGLRALHATVKAMRVVISVPPLQAL